MCLGKVLKKVSYVGLDSMYIKVSGILEGTKVGVFVGIPDNRVEYEKYLAGCLWRCFFYSARFYSQ